MNPGWYDSPEFLKERQRSRLFFNLVSPAFLFIDWKLRPTYREALEKLDFPRDWSVLDLGTGTGTLALALSERGHQVTGIDFAERLLKKARKRLPDADLRQMDLADLGSIEENSVDLVSMAYLLHGIPEDFRRFLLLQAVRIARNRVLVFDYPGPGPWYVRLIERIEGSHYPDFVSRDFRVWGRTIGLNMLRRGAASNHGGWWLIDAEREELQELPD